MRSRKIKSHTEVAANFYTRRGTPTHFPWLGVATATLAILIVFATFTWLTVNQLARRESDLVGAGSRHGIGTVTGVFPVDFANTGQLIPARLGLRFEGRDFTLTSDSGFEGLRPGSSVEVIYRVGRSGDVYVDSVGRTFIGQR